MKLDVLSEQLFECRYPDALEHVDRGIPGVGFYPGAEGFVDQSPEGGVMFLGRDWGLKRDYDGFCRRASGETGVTWRNFRDYYLPAFTAVPLWCTNYLLGLRKDGKATGNIEVIIPKDEWPVFEAYCWEFLQAQVLLQRPLLVVVLGEYNKSDLRRSDRLGGGHKLHHTFCAKGDKHRVCSRFRTPSVLFEVQGEPETSLRKGHGTEVFV